MLTINKIVRCLHEFNERNSVTSKDANRLTPRFSTSLYRALAIKDYRTNCVRWCTSVKCNAWQIESERSDPVSNCRRRTWSATIWRWVRSLC